MGSTSEARACQKGSPDNHPKIIKIKSDMHKRIFISLILFVYASYSCYTQNSRCIDLQLFNESFDSLIAQSKAAKNNSDDRAFQHKIYSEATARNITNILTQLDFPLNCDSIQKTTLIYCFHAQHNYEYAYLIVRDVISRNHYFAFNNPPGYLESIGLIQGDDYLSYAAEKLIETQSPEYDDFMIIATIENNRIDSFSASRRFSFFVHFQILAVIEKLIEIATKN